MNEAVAVHSQTRAWLKQSVLEAHISEYCTYLNRQGYALNTRRVYVCSVAHFANWIRGERVAAAAALDEGVVERFIRAHLPHCDCPYPVRRSVHEIRTALKHLLLALRAGGVIAGPHTIQNRLEAELVVFGEYMERSCGLALSTRSQRVRILRSFLSGCFGSGVIAAQRIKPKDLRQFVLRGQEQRSAGTMQVMGGALRCYLRFRAVSGDHVQHLTESVPRVAHWRLSNCQRCSQKARFSSSWILSGN